MAPVFTGLGYARANADVRYVIESIVPGEPRPATPGQVRLLVGLSSLMGLAMVTVVMVYLLGHQAASAQVATVRAFAVAMAAGGCYGMVLVRFVPLFGGSLPRRPLERTVLVSSSVVVLFVVEVVGRLAHQALSVTLGFIAGIDTILAVVLLIISFRHLSEIRSPRP